MTLPPGSQGQAPNVNLDNQDWEAVRDRVVNQMRRNWDGTPLADIEDAVQDAIIQVWQRVLLKKDVQNVFALTRHTAHNLLINKRRRNVKFPSTNLDDVAEAELASDHREAVADLELSEAIANAIQSLSPDLQIAFVLYVVQGMSTAEIANFLNISQAAAKQRCTRSQIKVRAYLTSLCEG